ncbi:TolC family protein [Balneolales bacterium ANBcel1]|nr:TolC family protein [Balneolales bacterium ANBcel1]
MNQVFHFILLAGLLIAITPLRAEPSGPIGLQEAVDIALENNREIKISEFEVKASESSVREVTGRFLPDISFGGQYVRNVKKPVLFLGGGMGIPGMENGGSIEIGYNNSYQASLNASMPLYSRQLIKSRQAASEQRGLTEVGLQDTRNRVTADVKRAFYTVLLSREVRDVTQKRMRNAEQRLAEVRRLHDEGLATEYDILVAEVQVENLRPELLQAKDELEASKLQLKNIMGITGERDITIKGELEPAYMRPVHEAATPHNRQLITNNYLLRMLDRQIQLMETNVEIERSSLYPTLSAFGSYQYETQDDSFDFGDYNWANSAAVGLQIQVPIFSGNSRRERVQQARIGVEQAREQRAAAEEALLTEIRTVNNRLKQIRERIEVSGLALQQAERAYELSVIRFEQGLGTQTDIHNSELAYTTSRFNRLQAFYEYQITLVSLDQLKGELAAR